MRQPSAMILEPEARPPALLRTLALALGLGAALALLGSIQSQAYFALHPGDAPPFAQSLAWSAAQWLSWALFVPAMVRFAWAFDFASGATARRIVQHLAFAAATCLAHLLLHSILLWLLPGGRAFMQTFGRGFFTLLVTLLHWELLSYALVVAAAQGLAHVQRARLEAMRRQRAETETVRATLSALKQQMQPHFLFNALNALVSMQTEDSPEQQYTIRLSGLLRRLLQSGECPTARLGEELEIVQGYLEIERARLGARLDAEMCVDPTVGGVALPALTLQPIVENAITHGIALDPDGGELRIEAKRCGEQIVVHVSNSLRSIDGAIASRGNGVALANCRERLRLLFGERARLTAEPSGTRGFRATIELPAAADRA